MQQQVRLGWPMTPAVKRILIANAVIWVVVVIAVNWWESTLLFTTLALIPEQVWPGLELWRPLTYLWVHHPQDLWHILGNSLFLWMFGGVLEQSWGTRAFVKFYLICGIGAGLIVLGTGLLFDPEQVVVGASGAIYGLVVAWVIAFPDRVIFLFGVFPIKGKYFALIPIGFAVADFLMRGSGVSHAAHLGGMVIGALLITGYWRPSKARARLRYWWLRRKIKVVESRDRRQPPPDGGYWH